MMMLQQKRVVAVLLAVGFLGGVPSWTVAATYRTANFLVTAPTDAIAKRVGDGAERLRKTLALRWLGRDMPTWKEPCPLSVKITSTESLSGSSFLFDNGKVLNQEMNLEGTLEQVLTSALPHEVTHTVLAFHFKKPIPRWADEGAAMLSESAAEQLRHEKLMRQIVDHKRRIPLRRLLSMRDYPRDVMMLYVEGHSLSRFLVQAGGRKTFLDFVAQSMKDGWDGAVKKHYAYRTVEELEAAWLASVATPRDEEAVAMKKPRGSLPTAPAPVQVLAALDSKGRLCVWRRVTSYVQRIGVHEGRRLPAYVPIQEMKASLHALETVCVYDTHGKKIDPKKLPEILKGEAPALVSADGQPVDPLHLRLVKEGTLIFVLPVNPRASPVAPTDYIEPAPPAPPAR